MQKKTFLMLLFMLVPYLSSFGTNISKQSTPFIGAQIFIEPGQTEVEIEQWFRLLAENHMNTCRIRMFGKYIQTSNGTYNFTLFDTAFKMAEKYGIKVYATLFPDTDFTDVGGFKFPHSDAHQKEVEGYIKNVVSHFSQYKNLTAWVLINEPGTPNLPFDEKFTQEHFANWQKEHRFSAYNEKGYPVLNFEKDKFVVDYHNWYLNWLAEQVRTYDKKHNLHVNPHNIFRLYGLYDFPTWRTFLNSLGGSAHASWHFGYFPRKSYTVGMSANAELIRSGAGELPWLMTELQGGNNLYSGANPLCPTAEEITQWLWINFATEAKGNIFWSFNARSTAAEAGEWAMIDFKNRATDRVTAASKIGKFIADNTEMMSNIQTVNSGISMLYNRESAWVEAAQTRGKQNGKGRSIGAAMCSPLSYFEALTEVGYQVSLKEFKEFDFSLNDFTNQVIILSHQIALDDKAIQQLESFVEKGGTLIADGLTGFYDYQAHSTMVSGFALENLFGASPIEFKLKENVFDLGMKNIPYALSAHLWKGTIETSKATPILDKDGNCIACSNQYGKGKVYWIPSPIALGARASKNYSELAKFTIDLLPSQMQNETIHFDRHHKDVFMKSFRSKNSVYSLIINKSQSMQSVNIVGGKNKGHIVFANKDARITANQVTITPEETVVIKWGK